MTESIETRPSVDREIQRITDLLAEARARTVRLIGPLSDDELREQHDPLMSPIVWDLGHIAHFEELWLTRNVHGTVEFGEVLLMAALVYHALNGYLEHLASTDQCVRVEQLYVNLIAGQPDDLVDPPDVLARIAKELIQQAVQRQADVTAAMAARLDEALVKQLWQEQASWRQSRPADWWFGAPPKWQWEGS